MNADEIVAELSTLGSESIKKVLVKHGAKEPFFGVKIGDLKPIQKRIKKNHELALELYDTGISDAMYLAGLIADPHQMTKPQLQKWVKKAYWSLLSDYTVAWVAAESRFGVELANEWIDSPKELIATAGWSTYSSLMAIKPDAELDLVEIERLLSRISKNIFTAQNRVRMAMNGFIISVGGYVAPLLEKAKATARVVGKVEADVGDTNCKIPDALSYIEKIERMGRVGKKRKTAQC